MVACWLRDAGVGQRILPPPFTKNARFLNGLYDWLGSEAWTARSPLQDCGCQAVMEVFIWSLKQTEWRSRCARLSDWKINDFPGIMGVESAVTGVQSLAFFLSILPPPFTQKAFFIKSLRWWLDRSLVGLRRVLGSARLTHR